MEHAQASGLEGLWPSRDMEHTGPRYARTGGQERSIGGRRPKAEERSGGVLFSSRRGFKQANKSRWLHRFGSNHPKSTRANRTKETELSAIWVMATATA